MVMDKRINANYLIIASFINPWNTDEEVVIGFNEKAPNPYVCWLCNNHNDYYWGRYYNTIFSAFDNYVERINNMLSYYREDDINE